MTNYTKGRQVMENIIKKYVIDFSYWAKIDFRHILCNRNFSSTRKSIYDHILLTVLRHISFFSLRINLSLDKWEVHK